VTDIDLNPPPGAIVVGVDSSPDSDRAVIWALGLAERTHQPVHFVHVQPSPPPYVEGDQAHEVWERAGRAVLDTAVAEAEQVHGVPVSAQTVNDTGEATAEALVRVSTDAAMLVLGARGHGGFSGLLMGSVSQHAARLAACPVVAVRAQADPRADRVVVGVDDSDGAQDALAVAFEIASRRHTDLTAIHASHAQTLYGRGVSKLPARGNAAGSLREQKAALDRLVAPWQQKYPMVTASTEVVPGHPGEVLTDASERASLVVVGSRGRGAFTGMLLGSVGQEVLHRARCPVVIAR
jgi:nucleotide-binding universal stress UspA family protein